MWGLKTFYYSLINKAGSKVQEEVAPALGTYVNGYHQEELDEDCEACKL